MVVVVNGCCCQCLLWSMVVVVHGCCGQWLLQSIAFVVHGIFQVIIAATLGSCSQLYFASDGG